jgi:subtilisin family serine protease
MSMRFRAGWLLALSFVVAVPAAAQQHAAYVVTAPQWGARQADAVQAAGGAAVYTHAEAGIALVESSSATFLADARASNAFSSVDADAVYRWQPAQPEGQILEAVASAGDNETFYALQWAPAAISAPEAWNAGCRGAGVRVAILDGGLHGAHIDLNGRIDVARSVSFVAGQAWNSDVGTFWHGTHVAGIVAANDNGIGTIGIAPDAKIIGVKVLHNGSGSFGAVIAGILYAATPVEQGGGGSDIINLSLGVAVPKDEASGLPGVMARAVNYATSRGVLVVAAAGNDAIDLDHAGNIFHTPSQSGTAIAVSATGPVGWAVGYPNGATNFDRPASYTNYGVSAVHVAAPGGDFAVPGNALCQVPTLIGTVTQFCWALDMVFSTVRGGPTSVTSYGWAAGTSMATAMVSAVAAIIKSQNPGISLGALKTSLTRATDDLGKTGRDPFYGDGFINAFKGCTQ